jgi:hypothetical protein
VDRRTRRFLAGGLLVTLIVAVAMSQFASDRPDGLEYVAEQEGFADAAREHDLSDSALADYGDGLTGNSAVDTAIAGLVGVLVTLGVGWVVFRLVRRRDDGAVTH